MPLSRAELERQISDEIAHPGITWVPPEELTGARTEACVDGRAGDAVIGTPGGNAGELLLLYGALEAAAGQRLDPDAMDDYLAAYMNRFGRFYMHGDTHALARLAPALLRRRPDDQGTAPEDAPESAEALAHRLADPPADSRSALLDALCRPETMGCGHLALMLGAPETYGVRAELTRALIRAFFRALWRGAPAEYVVLDGDHREAAVVLVTTGGDGERDAAIPLIRPRIGDRQVFVAHPQAAALTRRWEVDEVGAITGISPDPSALRAEIESLAERQMRATLEALAPGLPIYEVRFARARAEDFEVLDRGRVGDG